MLMLRLFEPILADPKDSPANKPTRALAAPSAARRCRAERHLPRFTGEEEACFTPFPLAGKE